MEDKEAVQMMERCVQELEDNRRTINQLQPMAEAYTVIRDVVNFAKRGGMQGYSEDLIWTLRKRIEELQPKVKVTDE